MVRWMYSYLTNVASYRRIWDLVVMIYKCKKYSFENANTFIILFYTESFFSWINSFEE